MYIVCTIRLVDQIGSGQRMLKKSSYVKFDLLQKKVTVEFLYNCYSYKYIYAFAIIEQ